MLRSGYLRQQAETCLRLSRRGSNRATAVELRVMAAEFFTRLAKLKTMVPGSELARGPTAGRADRPAVAPPGRK
jgi:hypothetical protein